jgi:hypothetical protein
MARSKLAGRRVRPKDKLAKQTIEEASASFIAAVTEWVDRLQNSVMSILTNGDTILKWGMPFVILLLLCASMFERNTCKVCHVSSGDCQKISTGLWDSLPFKREEYKPFEGRFPQENVFATAEVTCQKFGVSCTMPHTFGAHPCCYENRNCEDILLTDGVENIRLSGSETHAFHCNNA